MTEELRKEAERGYDLTKAKRVRKGRPPLGPAGVSPRVQIRVDPDLAEALKARAKEEQRSVSEIARTALREYVERAA
jgi:predicted HicB family RNase H-like nuclease